MSKKGEELTRPEREVLMILQNHQGKKHALSAKRLAEELKFSGRLLRSTINHLIIDHLIPIGSSTVRKSSGYFMIDSREEAKEFYHAFRSRGLTGLVKAARVEKVSLLEMSLQLTLDQYLEEEKIPGAGEAMTRLMKLFRKNPKLYAREIESLEKEAMPLLVDRDRMAEINQAAKHLQELTGGFVA